MGAYSCMAWQCEHSVTAYIPARSQSGAARMNPRHLPSRRSVPSTCASTCGVRVLGRSWVLERRWFWSASTLTFSEGGRGVRGGEVNWTVNLRKMRKSAPRSPERVGSGGRRPPRRGPGNPFQAAVIALNGPCEIQKTSPQRLPYKAPESPGPRDSPLLAGRSAAASARPGPGRAGESSGPVIPARGLPATWCRWNTGPGS